MPKTKHPRRRFEVYWPNEDFAEIKVAANLSDGTPEKFFRAALKGALPENSIPPSRTKENRFPGKDRIVADVPDSDYDALQIEGRKAGFNTRTKFARHIVQDHIDNIKACFGVSGNLRDAFKSSTEPMPDLSRLSAVELASLQTAAAAELDRRREEQEKCPKAKVSSTPAAKP